MAITCGTRTGPHRRSQPSQSVVTHGLPSAIANEGRAECRRRQVLHRPDRLDCGRTLARMPSKWQRLCPPRFVLDQQAVYSRLTGHGALALGPACRSRRSRRGSIQSCSNDGGATCERHARLQRNHRARTGFRPIRKNRRIASRRNSGRPRSAVHYSVEEVLRPEGWKPHQPVTLRFALGTYYSYERWQRFYPGGKYYFVAVRKLGRRGEAPVFIPANRHGPLIELSQGNELRHTLPLVTAGLAGNIRVKP
jgi:hypothetical protein